MTLLGVLACHDAPPEHHQPPAPVEPTPSAPVEVREVRGVWVTRWTYRTEPELEAVLDDVAEAGFTHVFLQVRGRFDALYSSEKEPWAKELSGTLGQDPGWDPLQTALVLAHARGMELHAWVNVYAMWQGGAAPRSVGVPHPLEQHRDWLVLDAAGRTTNDTDFAYKFASPANPAVREHVTAVVADLADRYDVDGIHLDYLRYPGRDFGHDWPAPAGVDFDVFRRQAIADTVAAIDERVEPPLSAAVWGIYRDEWGWGVSGGFDAYFQDSRAMVARGSLGAVAPMIYWPVEPSARLDFLTLAKDHVAHANGGLVWTGIEADKYGWETVLGCIGAAREAGAHGVVLFEYKALRDKGMLPKLAAGPFAAPPAVVATR